MQGVKTLLHCLQVVDDAEGPMTKREYEVTRVPVGDALCGQVVSFLGCPHGSQYQVGMDAQLPLLNDQLDMKSREQINSALFTGVKVSCRVCRQHVLSHLRSVTSSFAVLTGHAAYSHVHLDFCLSI